MPGQKAPLIGVTFGKDEQELHDSIRSISEAAGIPISTLLKKAAAASLLEDKDAKEWIAAMRPTFRTMKDFTAAAEPVALEA